MSLNPLDVYEEVDPDLLKHVRKSFEFAFSDGALPRKMKLLIAMALDASHGAIAGVKALSKAAEKAGASKNEILEALRVANYISGVGTVYVASHAFREIE